MTHATPAAGPAVLLESLLEESKSLRADVRAKEARQRRANTLIALGIAVALLVALGNLVLLLQSRDRGVESRKLIKTTAETSQRMADCTTAGGTCYREGQRRTGEAIAQITQMQIFIALCARTADTQAAVQACVEDKVAAAQAESDPSPSATADTGPSPAPSAGP